MLPFMTNNKSNTSFIKTRTPRWLVLFNRMLYRLYYARANKSGTHNKYRPEPTVTSEIIDKTQQLKNRKDWNQPLKDCRYILFDTETTGFYPYQGDEIISIGAVVVENGQICKDQYFHQLVNPYRTIPPVVVELTGISDEMVADKPGICAVLNDFMDFIGDSVLVAHNADFDLAFLNIKLNWYTQTEIYNPVLDTFKLSQALYPELLSHDLDTVLSHHKIPCVDRHTSLGDSLMTAEVFLNILSKLEEKQIDTLKQVYYYLHVKNSLSHF